MWFWWIFRIIFGFELTTKIALRLMRLYSIVLLIKMLWDQNRSASRWFQNYSNWFTLCFHSEKWQNHQIDSFVRVHCTRDGRKEHCHLFCFVILFDLCKKKFIFVMIMVIMVMVKFKPMWIVTNTQYTYSVYGDRSIAIRIGFCSS